MEAEQSAGAASDLPGHWREVDWRSMLGEVRRLQVRIVKAVETGRWGRLKALQRLLTTSRSGKLLAFGETPSVISPPETNMLHPDCAASRPRLRRPVGYWNGFAAR